MDTKTFKPEKSFKNEDDLESGSGDKTTDDDDDEDEDGDLDRRYPHPEDDEDNVVRNSDISNKSDSNTNEDGDDDDLTTTINENIEKTDGISSKIKQYNFDSKSMREPQRSDRKIMRNTFQSNLILILNSFFRFSCFPTFHSFVTQHIP